MNAFLVESSVLWDVYAFVFGFYRQAGFASYRSVTRFEYRSDGPMFVPGVNFDDGFDRIYLSVNSTSLWAQTMYQMSHECAHQIIYHLSCSNGLRECKCVSWIEELIAECCALAFLEYAGANWSKCRLSKRDFKYCFAIRTYLRGLIADMRGKDGVLLTCPTRESLLIVDAEFCEHRDWHACEVLDLVKCFDVSCMAGMFAYTHYVDFDTKLLDTCGYLRCWFGNRCVEYLCALQTAICDGSNLSCLR